jgi:hypothetical protein
MRSKTGISPLVDRQITVKEKGPAINAFEIAGPFSEWSIPRLLTARDTFKSRAIEASFLPSTKNMLTAFTIVIGCLVAGVFILLRKR